MKLYLKDNYIGTFLSTYFHPLYNTIFIVYADKKGVFKTIEVSNSEDFYLSDFKIDD